MIITPHPCRLYFILAREAPIGVIFRRGPSKWVQLIKWRTETDEFEPGQWFHGRIYERRCDLSPSGEKLIYFAAQMKQGTLDPSISYSWTAISKPPYLTALMLWPKGDCWNGGGLFLGENSIWLNDDGPRPHRSHDEYFQALLSVTTEGSLMGEDNSILPRRLERDGWRLVKEWKGERVLSKAKVAFEVNAHKARSSEVQWLRELHRTSRSRYIGYVTYGAGIHEKQTADGRYSLMKRWTLIGMDDQEFFEVRDNTSGERYDLGKAAWADWDQAGRLVFVADGKLFAGEISAGRIERRELADFNGNKFEPVETPEWAKRW